MANVDRQLFRNDSKTYTDENGVEQYGVAEWGYRDPVTHQVIFGDPDDITEGAREKAAELGVNVHEVEGSGKGGKVTATDVEKAAK